MQKSKFLNIILASAVLVLTILLTNKNDGSNKPTTSPIVPFADSLPAASHAATIPFKKKSLGIRTELYPKPALVIGSYDKEGKPNMMTAAWVSIANSNPLSIAVSMRPATYSHGNVTETKSFTVNIPSSELAKYVDYVGRFSGKDVDKFKETGLTPVRGEFVNAPYIKEFPIVIECELTEFHDLGSHRQFIGKVIDVKADEAILDSKGNVDVNLLNPLIYAGGNYYETGRLIAKVGEALKDIDGQPFVPNYSQRYENETLEVIHNRKSVRHFTDQPVSKEQIETLLRAGMAAPTAVNRQPWAFYVVTERETLDTLSQQLPYAKMLSQVQAAIVVCGDMEKAGNLKDEGYWVQDCAAATENILLAAESIGLGAVWTASYPYDDRTKAVIKALNLPEKYIPLNVIPIGYPTGEDVPKDKWKAENVIWQ
ncbi:flavin reductase [Labilibaculum antarcticum]|uniref:Flavoredoxin n=1 Tax=Labilibaculum antarcticum TaxID=1717717 RepID=A0A1Y1CLA1_9BACT|nr:nitroreductase family protein [Labilibaculum antarcticum]BAX81074.1 flavoredoxin [Labilibaculum antarcticum]